MDVQIKRTCHDLRKVKKWSNRCWDLSTNENRLIMAAILVPWQFFNEIRLIALHWFANSDISIGLFGKRFSIKHIQILKFRCFMVFPEWLNESTEIFLGKRIILVESNLRANLSFEYIHFQTIVLFNADCLCSNKLMNSA